jgi:hypothetical protein
MRLLKKGEGTKRGCRYCTDVGRKFDAHRGGVRLACQHTECPFTVLDKYETYEDYMESKDGKLDVAAFMDAVCGGGRATEYLRAIVPALRGLGRGPLF